jgi:hypothetical protein
MVIAIAGVSELPKNESHGSVAPLGHSDSVTALVCALAVTAGAAAAERVECRVTDDNWMEAPPREPHSRESLNHGSDQQLIISGQNSFALLAFDVSPARGLRVGKAVLRVRRKPDPVPLTVVGVSTISGSGAWAEGEMNYFFARSGGPWSYPGSDLAGVAGVPADAYTIEVSALTFSMSRQEAIKLAAAAQTGFATALGLAALPQAITVEGNVSVAAQAAPMRASQ